MPLIYITGPSGSGKSTVCAELKARGLESHDADSEGINLWYDNRTNQVVGRYKENKPFTEEWFKTHSLKTDNNKVEKLANDAKNKVIYLCGVSSNEKEFLHLLDKVIFLLIDEYSLRERLATRSTNQFGKQEYELKHVLDGLKFYSKDYLKNSITIDATLPIDQVIDGIIKVSK